MNIETAPFERTSIPDAVARLAPPAVLERWRDIDRSASQPQLVTATQHGEVVGAALITARPHTSYCKIVDVVGAVEPVVQAVVEAAQQAGQAQVKWEGDAGSLGFTALTPPLSSGPGSDAPAQASVRWLVPEITVQAVPYYAQTTYYTCGSVTALSALAALVPQGEAPLDEEQEMAFWKEANNHPACEPVGLGVAIAQARPELKVTIALDSAEPVILEHLEGEDRAWRAGLQRESRLKAERLGIPIRAGRMTIDELAAAVKAGSGALLLLSLALMRGMPVPHWVRCCGTAGDTVVIDDPAVDPATGESWVDGHLLPIPAADLDAMAAYGDGGYRGAVLLRR
ncbi:peptidase C39 family protein [Kineosporia babensis]|uniref:Peptidase C39 family protein n=1 Tax=Kineosporia babensis TaxID=499548 RepID=A0A9X1NJF2_9ACTN|nr:peptidase C39 family protein [Kineosporia babensis]MCD5314821.1 peptidase C39 family protein [Kineosporia babensis]